MSTAESAHEPDRAERESTGGNARPLGPAYRSIIFDVKGTPDQCMDATEYILDHMDERWSEFGLEWLGGQGWPTDEVVLMPCPASNPGPKDVVD